METTPFAYHFKERGSKKKEDLNAFRFTFDRLNAKACVM
jgi:hypothetical protein